MGPGILKPLRIARPRLSLLLALVAIGLMIASAYFFRPGTNREFIASAALTFGIGGLVLGVALALFPAQIKTLVPAAIALTPERSRWSVVGAGALLLVLVAESSGNALQIAPLATLSVHIQFGLLLVGVLLVGWGLAGGIRLNLEAVEPTPLILLCLIIVGGLIVRVWELETSARFMQDETVFIDALREFWDGRQPRLMNGGGLATISMVYPYWNAGTVELFGRNLVGLRSASVLIGLLAIPAAYGLVRVLYDDQKIALLAALFVATFPPHIHFSRISWGHMGDSLFGLMALLFIARAIRWNRRADWAFAGVSLGLTQYFYEVGRLLFPPLVVGWLVLLVLAWKMRSYWRGFGIMLLAALLVAAPVYYSLAVRGAEITPRMQSSAVPAEIWTTLSGGEQSEQAWRELTQRSLTPFLVYTHHPDSLSEYYGGFAGFVPPPLVPLFLLGVLFVLWRAPRPVSVLVLALLLVSVANIFANNGGYAPRYTIVIPLIPILMAIGLYEGLHLLRLLRIESVLAVIAVLAATWQTHFYFNIHLPFYNEQRRAVSPERDIFDAVFRTVDLPANTEVFLIDPSPTLDHGRASRLYHFLQDVPYQIQAPQRAAFDPAALPRDRNYAFFIALDDDETFERIRQAFPDVQPPQYTTYTIPEWDQYMLLLWLSQG